jgi:Na+/proline symporter
MAISGAIYSIGGFALLAFGLYWRRASRVGAYLALLTGFLAVFGLGSVQNVLNPAKRWFGFTREIPVEELTDKMVLAQELVPGGAVVEVYKDVSSAVVGLVVLGTAIVLMIVGSLLFPDKKQSAYHTEREDA